MGLCPSSAAVLHAPIYANSLTWELEGIRKFLSERDGVFLYSVQGGRSLRLDSVEPGHGRSRMRKRA